LAQFADIDTNVTASQDAFAQTATSSSQSYELYQNNDFGLSIQYPSNWSYNPDFSKSSYGVVTFTPNDNAGNIAFQIIFIKDEIQIYRGLQDQAYLNTMVSDLSRDCSAKSITISGYQCSDFKLLDSKVASYQDDPAYDGGIFLDREGKKWQWL
jgi:hypothetical protein